MRVMERLMLLSMDKHFVSRINYAVDWALDLYMDSEKGPMDALTDYLDQLQFDGWPETEVALVRSIVERVLHEREYD
jgi:hypothetical protein